MAARALLVDFLVSGVLDTTGNPLAGGKVYTYDAGTLTPKSLYTGPTKTGLTAANPYTLDGNGKAQLYGDGAYKFIIKTSADVTLYTYDNVDLYAFVATASATFFNVLDYGAIGSGLVDDTAGIQAAIAACSTAGGGNVVFPPGTYRHTGITVPAKVNLIGSSGKNCKLVYTPTSGNSITLTGGAVNTNYNIIENLNINCATTSSGIGICGPADPYFIADVYISNCEIEGFLRGIYLPYCLQVLVSNSRLLGQGKGVASGVGIQLGDRTLGTPRLCNVGLCELTYVNGYRTCYTLDGSVLEVSESIAENCIIGFLIGARLTITGSWVQADTTLYQTRAGNWPVQVFGTYHLDGASAEVDDVTSMVTLGDQNDLQVSDRSGFKNTGVFRLRFATSLARALQIGTAVTIHSNSSSARVTSAERPLEVDRSGFTGAGTLFGLYSSGTARGFLGTLANDNPALLGSGGSQVSAEWDNLGNLFAGAGSLGTTSTNGFLFIPSCAGTPTGVPQGYTTGKIALVFDATNHKLYAYDGAWRDVGP